MLSEGVNKGRITLEHLVELVCHNTAKTFGLFPRKGTIRIGSDADMVLLDLDKEQVMSPEHMRSLQDFSLYDGWNLKGWPVTTILRGEVVYEDGEVTGKHGYGRAIARDKDRKLLPVE
jgi:dihydropyrimidinase